VRGRRGGKRSLIQLEIRKGTLKKKQRREKIEREGTKFRKERSTEKGKKSTKWKKRKDPAKAGGKIGSFLIGIDTRS